MKTSEWTAALRSGDYGQCQETLSDGQGNFCCLGVLCEAAGLPKAVEDLYPDPSAEKMVEYLFEGPSTGQTIKADASLPSFAQREMLEDLDLTMKVPDMVYTDGTLGFEKAYPKQSLHDRLMNLNDDGASFAYIADYIERVRADGQR